MMRLTTLGRSARGILRQIFYESSTSCLIRQDEASAASTGLELLTFSERLPDVVIRRHVTGALRRSDALAFPCPDEASRANGNEPNLNWRVTLLGPRMSRLGARLRAAASRATAPRASPRCCVQLKAAAARRPAPPAGGPPPPPKLRHAPI